MYKPSNEKTLLWKLPDMQAVLIFLWNFELIQRKSNLDIIKLAFTLGNKTVSCMKLFCLLQLNYHDVSRVSQIIDKLELLIEDNIEFVDNAKATWNRIMATKNKHSQYCKK